MDSLKLSSLVPERPTSLQDMSSSSMFGSNSIELALEQLGVDLTRVQVQMPRQVARVIRQFQKLPVGSAQHELIKGRLRRRYAGTRVVAPGEVLLAFYASDVEPPVQGLFATYDDMTVRQAIDHSAFGYGGLSAGQAEVALSRQKRWFQGALVCFVQSQWAADSVVGDYGVSAESVVIVGQKVQTTQSVVDARERDWSVPRFLFAGLNWERKNGDRVVEGFRSVRAAHPNAELHLVGRVPVVDEPGVTSHGFLDHSNAEDKRSWFHLLSTCTCFVLPSLIEPGGTAHAEAVTSGLPAIGTKIGGNREVIGAAGIVVTPTDQRELTDAMLRMCNPELAQRLGKLGPDSAGISTSAEIAVTVRDAITARLSRGD